MTQILKDPTHKVLTKMSIPISIGMLSTFLFQVIDTYFIGQLGAQPLTALSFASTLYFILMSLYIGLSIGVSVLVARAFGAQEMVKLGQLNITSLVLTSFISIAISCIILWLFQPIFMGLGASPEVYPLIYQYMQPLVCGVPFIAVGITMSGILRATGTITSPEVVMGIAGIINLVFDYLLIFGHWGFPKMGIAGGAYATVLSWVFVLIGMTILWIKNGLFKGAIPNWVQMLTNSKEMFQVSLPTISTQMVGPLTITFITYLLAQQSQESVAAYGVASRIEMLLLIGVLAVSTALTPFIAQNAGAQLKTRIDEAIVYAGKSSVYLGVLVAVILYLFVEQLAEIFSESSQVVSNTAMYFYAVSLSYIFYALYVMTTSIFNGLQQTSISLKITLMRSVVFMIPLGIVGAQFGVNGVFIGIAGANVLAGVWAGCKMRRAIKEMKSSLVEVNIPNDYLADVTGWYNRLVK